MKFVNISSEEFCRFAVVSPYKSFMQTPEIAKLRETSGWTAHYVAAKDSKDRILAASMLVSKPTFLKKRLFYAPGGPLLDLEDKKLTIFFFQHLRDYIEQHHGYSLQIDPYYELVERDRNGDLVPGGFNHEDALETLKSIGFKPIKDTTQPKYLFALDLDHRTPDELFASFKQNTRNLISRTKRSGVVVRELEKNELPLFKKITESTSERRGFTDRSLSYYEQMYDLFHKSGEVKFIVAETTVLLSTAMFMLYGNEVIYLFSGSDKKYMKEYNAQYAIQWYMIKYAAEHGFKRYNFYGIQGLPDPSKKDYGIYLFKKGFGGQVIELIGSFELPISNMYYLHQLLSKTKGVIKK